MGIMLYKDTIHSILFYFIHSLREPSILGPCLGQMIKYALLFYIIFKCFKDKQTPRSRIDKYCTLLGQTRIKL